MLSKIKFKLARRIRRAGAEAWLRKLVDGGNSPLRKLGTAHSGWTVTDSAVRPGCTAICVGAGEDISFDIELNKSGLNVITVDPTPRSKVHVEQVLDGSRSGGRVSVNRSASEFYDLNGFDRSRFKYVPVGVWDQNVQMRFFAPKDKAHVSHSVMNLQKTSEYFEANCVTLRDLCTSVNVTDISILKMDVEGAEYNVLRNVIANGPLPAAVCVEFDEIRNSLDAGYRDRIAKAVDLMKSNGYRFRFLEESNALFERIQ